MKKNIKISLIIVLAFVLVGVSVLYKSRNKQTVPSPTIKTKALEDIQRFDDLQVSGRLAKKFSGKENILTEHLDRLFEEIDVLIVEIKTAVLEGRVKKDTSGFNVTGGSYIKTSKQYIGLEGLADSGTFKSCSNQYYLNGDEQKVRRSRPAHLFFHDDRKTVKQYSGFNGEYLSFGKDGTIREFNVDIDGKHHSINWDVDGKITSYDISDIPKKPADNL